MFNIGWVNRMFILSIIGLNLPERTVREVVLSFTLKNEYLLMNYLLVS